MPVNKRGQQATHTRYKTDKNLKHTVSTACRPGVFQVALFKGFPNIPHIPLPLGHSVVTNEATMAPTPENAPCWHDWHRPREIWLIGGIDSEHILVIGVTTQRPAEVFFYQKRSAPHSGPYSGKILPRTGGGLQIQAKHWVVDGRKGPGGSCAIKHKYPPPPPAGSPNRHTHSAFMAHPPLPPDTPPLQPPPLSTPPPPPFHKRSGHSGGVPSGPPRLRGQ